MDTIILILLAVTFVALVVYILKGGNVMIGFFALAVIWGVLGGMNIDDIQNTIIHGGATGYGATVVIMAFGAWFARIMMSTGIIEQIIRKVVELGGSRPLITLILLSIVTTLIFMGAYGIGPVMAVGMITIPIMLTLGIPKNLAIASLTIAVAAGNYCAVGVWTQYSSVFPGVAYQGQFFNTALIACGIQLGLLIVYEIIRFGKSGSGKLQRTWAVAAPKAPEVAKPPAGKKIFFLAYFTPVVPVALCAFAGWQAVPSFIVAILWALVFTSNLLPWKKCVDTLLKSLQEGFTDIGLLLGMLIMINVFTKVAAAVAPFLGSYLQAFIPTNPIVIAAVVGILAPLALFRGPLMFWGVGAAIATIFVNMGEFSEIYSMFLIMIPSISMAFSCCLTQSWNMWAINHSKLESKEFLKATVPWQWMTTLVILIVTGLVIGR